MQENDLKRENTKLKLEILGLKDQINRMNGNLENDLGGYKDGVFQRIGPVGITKYLDALRQNRMMKAILDYEIRRAR